MVRASRFYTKAQDGLSKPWKGRVWCNPPYSLLKQFTNKLLSEWKVGRIEGAIFFVTSFYTNNTSFQSLLREASAICFARGRIPFQQRGQTYSHHRQGHALFYFGS